MAKAEAVGGPDLFWQFMNERHQIFLRRRQGQPWPWTEDPILKQYKFTNIYRELDRTTVWMRDNITRPIQRMNLDSDVMAELLLLNCALFRMFGTIEFAEAYGKIVMSWNRDTSKHLQILARDRINKGLKVFTGAYVVTNMGLTDPKEQVVCERFIQPIWDNRSVILTIATTTNSLEQTHTAIRRYEGWGGTGFMAYELVSDLRWTPILSRAKDVCTWANPGPGCLRGLYRVYGAGVGRSTALARMRELYADAALRFPQPIEMREIEHTLCEFDKYCRAKFGEGRPRSMYRPPDPNILASGGI